MKDQLVLVPCDLPHGSTGPVLIEDADGWPIEICVQPIGHVRGRLCVSARWVRAAGGRHRFASRMGMKHGLFKGHHERKISSR
jgi:hypothetical protein